MGKEYYFKTDDKLDRQKYAEFLKSMLENCDKYHREDSEGAYVIAIDSPWGTGKTRFAKMLRNFLEDRTKDKEDDSKLGRNASFNTIYYNSWETDFSDDALLPIIYAITNSPEFKIERFNSKSKKVLGKFLDAAAAVAKVTAYTVLHNFAGEKVVEMVDTGVDALTNKTSNPLEKYEERLSLLIDFRQSLENVIKKTKNNKLVIIVDELDRCRPTFAIQTLELAKHLFSVEGLIFIFALDVKQLSCSVKTVYGQEMDASGYLCRFFDYMGRIPTPKLKQFIKTKLMQIDYYKVNQSLFLENNTEFITRLALIFNFSLRDIDTILKTYNVMNKCFLEKYDEYQKHQLYLFLLSLKYMDIEAYNKALKVTPVSPKAGATASEKYVLNSHSDLAGILNTLNQNDILRNAFFEMAYYRGEKKSFSAKIISVDTLKWESSGEITIQYRSEPGRVAGQINSIECKEYSWGHVLFYEDLAKWEEIKEMTVSGYLYSQLEMFNFALPADELGSKT